MQIVKQSVARSIPVLLIQTSDGQTPKTGATEGQMTLSYRKEGATSWSSKTATGNWTEVGKGVYLIDWSTSDLNTIGRFDIVAEHADSINFYGSLVVSANLLDDIDTTLDALNDLDAAAILAAITTDSTKWAGANIDASIASRSSHSAAAVVALMNDPSAAEIEAAIAAIHGPGNYEGAGAAPTVAEIAAAIHDIKATFNKTTGALVITMADDTALTSVTITDTATEVTRA
jgi:hypothetical protein